MDPVAGHCGACIAQSPAFDATIAAIDYVAPVDQLVLALKFGQRLALAHAFATMLSRASAALPQLPTQLIATPLSPQRLRERGFNQAHEIAKPLARDLQIRLTPSLLSRQRDTQAQAMLPPDQRRRNVRNAFMLTPDAIQNVRGQHVGVVDDVMTTGATLNEIAATLKRFGAVRVTNFVFARTSPK